MSIASLAGPCQAFVCKEASVSLPFAETTGGRWAGWRNSKAGRRRMAVSALQTPKGFGPEKKEKSGGKKSPGEFERSQEEGEKKRRQQQQQQDEEEDAELDAVPEVVTNRMMKRIGLTVGLPTLVGILAFPLYYYVKVVQKVEVPEWLPLITSMFTFGTAGLGISYGILSASWDPQREGSLLGWKEAQANWPVLWENLSGNKGKK